MIDGPIFDFEAIDATLDLVPMAARRLLDHLGCKLSLEAWRSLTLADRQQLVQLGIAEQIDVPRAQDVLRRAKPAPQAIDPCGDPPTGEVPQKLVETLRQERPLSLGQWAGLDPFRRWTLLKTSRGKHPENCLRAYDEIMQKPSPLTHLNAQGQAHMVETQAKPVTLRRAVAGSNVSMTVKALECLTSGTAPKGDVLATARIAAIMAAKNTSQLIPLCHPLRLTGIDVDLVVNERETCVEIRAEVSALDRTGVEMEAMVAASVAALTLYDMLKAIDRAMVIGPTRLLEKSGGKSGDYRA